MTEGNTPWRSQGGAFLLEDRNTILLATLAEWRLFSLLSQPPIPKGTASKSGEFLFIPLDYTTSDTECRPEGAGRARRCRNRGDGCGAIDATSPSPRVTGRPLTTLRCRHPNLVRASLALSGAGCSSECGTNLRVASPTNGLFRLFNPPTDGGSPRRRGHLPRMWCGRPLGYRPSVGLAAFRSFLLEPLLGRSAEGGSNSVSVFYASEL